MTHLNEVNKNIFLVSTVFLSLKLESWQLAIRIYKHITQHITFKTGHHENWSTRHSTPNNDSFFFVFAFSNILYMYIPTLKVCNIFVLNLFWMAKVKKKKKKITLTFRMALGAFLPI